MADLLTSVAEVSVTIAGFSGLFVAFSSRSRSMTPVDRYALFFLLFCSLSAALLALLAFVLLSLTGRSDFAPWFCVLSGTVILSISIWSSRSRLRTLRSPNRRRYPWLRRVFMPVQWGVGLLQFLPLVTDVNPYTCYALALWWLVFAAALQFIIQIVAASRKEVERG